MNLYKSILEKRRLTPAILLVALGISVQAFGGSSNSSLFTDATDDSDSTKIDITDAIFTGRSADCADYVNSYEASALDIQNSIDFKADVLITSTTDRCTFKSNSIPNHNFNDLSASFAGGELGATISEIEAEYNVTRNPQLAPSKTPLSQEITNAVFLNGVVLDLVSAGCYSPNSPDAGEDGNTGIGCSSGADWLLDPLGTEHKFGLDQHNGHTQAEGLYHYHGNPNAMFDDNPGPQGSPVIGFAADGFPIYGNYFYDSNFGTVRKALSGYRLKSGSRGTRSATNPGGDYDGTYVDDWEFTDRGDLDECNGMTVNGQYGYYVTDTFPWVMGCISGTPDPSFYKGGGNGGTAPPAGSPSSSKTAIVSI